MTTPVVDLRRTTRIAFMGGAYGNLPALDACLRDARAARAEALCFLGDSIGCCGHSDEVVDRIEAEFTVLVAGNHEQEAFAGSQSCGCGYADAEDERISCIAFNNAVAGLSADRRARLGRWPNEVVLETACGRVLLCHGSPSQTNELLYEVDLDDEKIGRWLAARDLQGFVCTHSGLPFARFVGTGGFAVNCGVVGKPDHDGDTAVHYALLTMTPMKRGCAVIVDIKRVTYDHRAWAAQLRREGIDDMFVSPIESGCWTSGVTSLPAVERQRPERPHTSRASSRPAIRPPNA